MYTTKIYVSSMLDFLLLCNYSSNYLTKILKYHVFGVLTYLLSSKTNISSLWNNAVYKELHPQKLRSWNTGTQMMSLVSLRCFSKGVLEEQPKLIKQDIGSTIFLFSLWWFDIPLNVPFAICERHLVHYKLEEDGEKNVLLSFRYYRWPSDYLPQLFFVVLMWIWRNAFKH